MPGKAKYRKSVNIRKNTDYICPKKCKISAYHRSKEDCIMQKYVCTLCGYEYDPEVGDPDSGIAPGTAFEDIPEDWVCPVCGVGKENFQPA